MYSNIFAIFVMFSNDLFQGLAIYELHDDVMLETILANVVNGHDIGVAEIGSGMGFALETLEEALIAREAFVEYFDGYDTP